MFVNLLTSITTMAPSSKPNFGSRGLGIHHNKLDPLSASLSLCITRSDSQHHFTVHHLPSPHVLLGHPPQTLPLVALVDHCHASLMRDIQLAMTSFRVLRPLSKSTSLRPFFWRSSAKERTANSRRCIYRDQAMCTPTAFLQVATPPPIQSFARAAIYLDNVTCATSKYSPYHT